MEPSAPRRVSTPREVLTGLAILLPVFGALLWLTFGRHWNDAQEMRRQAAIWKTGVPARSVVVEGEESVHHVIETLGLVRAYTYELTVRYVDQDGGSHERPLRVESIGRGMDRTIPPEVRHDPKAPDEFALSWAIRLGWARWAWTLLAEALGTVVAILVILVLVSAFRQLRLARAHAADA